MFISITHKNTNWKILYQKDDLVFSHRVTFLLSYQLTEKRTVKNSRHASTLYNVMIKTIVRISFLYLQ